MHTEVTKGGIAVGVTVQCKKTGRSLDMGYGGFNRWRDKIAELYGGEWWEHYKTLDDAPILDTLGQRTAFFEAFDRRTLQLITEKRADIKIVDFCLQPDCDGSVNYGACKNILKAIGDYTDNKAYGYAAYADHDWERLKAILQECVDTKSKLVWS